MREAVGLVDIVFTVALTLQITCSILYPSFRQSLERNQEETMKNGNVHRNFELEEKKEENEWWTWALLGICALCGTLSFLAAIALIMSTRTGNNEGKRAIELTRFWMHCNVFTIVVFTMTFMFLLPIDIIQDGRLGSSIPTLVYIGFRLIFTFVIWKQLDAMSPTMFTTLDRVREREREEERQRQRQRGVRIHWAHPFGSRVQLEYPVIPLSPTLPLRHYRRGSLSAPSCQCVTAQPD